MTRRRTSIRPQFILGFLVVLAIFILPPTARAQTCGSPGVTTQVTNFSVSPATIIAWSGVATGTITLNCTEPSNTTFALSSSPAGSLLFRADPSNPCGGICIPAGSSSGTNFQNGLNNCITKHRIKCTQKGPCEPAPVPVPSPKGLLPPVPALPPPSPSTTLGVGSILLIITIIVFSPVGA